MGITAENVARYARSERAEMEAPWRRATGGPMRRRSAGVFDAEIVPVNAVQETEALALFRRDEGIRPRHHGGKSWLSLPCFLRTGW